MIPVIGQRWLWIFGGGKYRSETIGEVTKTYRDSNGQDCAEVKIVSIIISNNPADKIGATFGVWLSRFDTSEFEYLPGQDKP